jgi:hypothetical protein
MKTLTQEGSEHTKIIDDVTPVTGDVEIRKRDVTSDVGNIVDHVLQSLNEKIPESDARNNVETSGTQEELVEDSLPATPVDNTVSNELQETDVVITEGNTHLDESESPKSKDVEENSSADKTMEDNFVIVNVEESPIKEIPSDGIAKRLRTRNGKASVSTSAPRKEEKTAKKTGLKPQLYGPKKSWSKGTVSSEKKKNLKRKAPPSSDSEYDVEQDVKDILDSEDDNRQNVGHDVVSIGLSGRKKIHGKKIPQNVPDAPMDNVSFHSLAFAHRWNFVFHRRLTLERELSKDAEKNADVMKLIEKAGLKKIVLGIGECYVKLVKEFLVNIPADCDNPISKDYLKVYVRGKCVNFSPVVINRFLGRSEDAQPEFEVTDNEVCKTITADQIKQWPKKGKVSASKLSVKYDVLNRIGAVNWVPTTHTADVATGLARFIYIIGNEIPYDFETYIFDQTMKHGKTLAVKLPITFPSLLCSIILSQHPNILVKEDVACTRESPMTISPRLLEGQHVTDIVGQSSKATTGKMTRKEAIANLKETCQALDERKTILESIISALELEEANEVADVTTRFN